MAATNKVLDVGHDFTMPNEEIIVSTEIPLRGWDEVSLLAITKTGNTANRDVDVFYRFTKNAVVYNDWINIGAFESIPLGIRDDCLIEFKIKRIGSDATGIVTLDTVRLDGNFEQTYWDVWNFIKDTIFAEIEYDDYDWNRLWINLLIKLYERQSIVPEYIERGDLLLSSDHSEEDYIVFWKVVAYFYALLSELSRRKTSGLTEDDQYLIEHLEGKGLFLCAQCMTCNSDHIYIMQNIFDEFRQRGTPQIAMKKGTDGKVVDGEMLRMICYDPRDEFLFEHLPRHLSGWTVNRTSPIYRGKSGHIQLNKTPEHTKDFVDLDLYETNGTPTIIADGSRRVASLDNGDSIGFTSVAEAYLTYELSFWVRFSTANVGLLTVEVNGYEDTNPVNLQKVSGGIETKILDTVAMPNNSVYYHVKCFVYAKGNLIYGNDAKTNLLQGEHLKFTATRTNKLQFTVSCTGAGSVRIWDMKCVPAVFDVSSVYINSYNVMNAYVINRNAAMSIIDFEENMRRYMVPYGTIFQMFYSPKSQFAPEIYLAHNDDSLLLQNEGGYFLI